MVYGENAKQTKNFFISPEKSDDGNRTIDLGPITMTGRNANGYPISNLEQSLTKKNLERYSKGSFVGHNPR